MSNLRLLRKLDGEKRKIRKIIKTHFKLQTCRCQLFHKHVSIKIQEIEEINV